jgi:cysteine desulfurase / selenocysteine lyase
MNAKIKKDFPFLASKNLIYFDNAATTHKPQQVIDAITKFYSSDYATIHRSIYKLSEQATQHFEHVRQDVAEFIGAKPEEIIFTQGTTYGINFIATAWARTTLKPGDEIVLTELEHHSNLIPWQQVSTQTGAVLKFIPINPDGSLDLENLSKIITERTKLVSSIHVSNAIGTHVDIATINKAARSVDAYFLIDAAQSVPHQKIDVKKLDADFLVFSGHKLLGPTGIGILYIKKEVQERIPPYQFGGGMVFHADYHTATWLKPPHCYEAGTPPIAQVIGLGAALSYIKKNIDYEKLKIHEASLCSHAITELQKIPGITLLGPLEQLKQKGHLLSFTVQGFHPHDVGAFLDHHAITVRSGHYCAQPLAQKLGIDGSIRISFYAYNSREEVDHFIDVMKKLVNKKS